MPNIANEGTIHKACHRFLNLEGSRPFNGPPRSRNFVCFRSTPSNNLSSLTIVSKSERVVNNSTIVAFSQSINQSINQSTILLFRQYPLAKARLSGAPAKSVFKRRNPNYSPRKQNVNRQSDVQVFMEERPNKKSCLQASLETC